MLTSSKAVPDQIMEVSVPYVNQDKYFQGWKRKAEKSTNAAPPFKYINIYRSSFS